MSNRQTDNKGTPTDRPLNPYHKTSDFGDRRESWNEPQFAVFEEGVQATLDHLAKVTDEELVKGVAGILLGRRMVDMPISEMSARKVLAYILPVLSARHQDESSDYRRQVNEGDW